MIIFRGGKRVFSLLTVHKIIRKLYVLIENCASIFFYLERIFDSASFMIIYYNYNDLKIPETSFSIALQFSLHQSRDQ